MGSRGETSPRIREDTCLNASCGDSFVQAGVEECDDGNDDNTVWQRTATQSALTSRTTMPIRVFCDSRQQWHPALSINSTGRVTAGDRASAAPIAEATPPMSGAGTATTTR